MHALFSACVYFFKIANLTEQKEDSNMNIIGRLLSRIFNNTFVEKESIKYKINYIKNNTPDLYSTNMFLNKSKFIEKDIVKYNELITTYINSDYVNTSLDVKKVTDSNMHSLSFAKWLTNDMYVLNNSTEYLFLFLDNSDRLLILVNKMLSNAENYIPYNNGYMLQPYVTNIKMIIDELYLMSK